MARRVIRAAVLLAVSLLFPALCVAVPASAVTGNGSVVTRIGGVPPRVAGGGGFTAVFTVESTSRYRMLVDSLFLRVSAPDDPSGPPDGVSVTWQDPATGAWRSSDTRSGTGWGLTLDPPLTVEPHGTLTFRARIGLDAALPGGTYAVATNGVSGYRLVDPSGRGAGLLEGRNQPRAVFRYAGPGPSGPATASVSAPAPVSASASAVASATAGPTRAPSPSDPPSATGTPSAAAASADSPAPTALSALAGPGPGGGAGTGGGPGPGSVSGTLLLGLGSIAAGFALGAAALLIRRRQSYP
ncbi:hypothetical protein [Kitasatospora sp. NPDC090308]|uniref:hypothetical protein n=1 Tax=Kitasatospora sp. NPDC090308 TaxID=3364082 RepID=UPI003819DD4F